MRSRKPIAPASTAWRARSAIRSTSSAKWPARRPTPGHPWRRPGARRGVPGRRRPCRSFDPASTSRYSGNDFQSQSRPSWRAIPGMSSTPSINSIRPVVIGSLDRGETDPAVAGDRRGDAVPRRRLEALVPRDLPVVVGVGRRRSRGRRQRRRRSSSRRPVPLTRPTSTTSPPATATSARRGAPPRCRRRRSPL